MKKTLDIKKLILLNMPYILMGLFATNFGEAWRMAQGADASEKFLSLIAVLPGALQSFWPSLHPLDLLVGLCCGGSLRLAVYLKSKNAKKYRHGLEYGSARWGTREDIAPYVDPVFQNNVILTKTESLTMNSRPKDPKTARNKNVLVIGGSGSGKTRFWLKPNLMQMHKTAIFEGWCDFLNYFDSSIHFQLSFLNLAASEETFANSISIPPQRDAFDSIREEYTTMLQNQLARGNNGLIKTKYLTFGIDADSIKAAKPRLERIETDILNNFKRLGVAARTLDGKERLSQLHAVFHMDEQLPFQFEWDWLAPSGLSTKDFIAPSSFEFRTGKQFRMGKKYGAVSFLQILAPELNDRLLADFLDMESSLIVSMHIQSVDQVKAIKTVKRKITDLDRSKIEEQKKAVRAGYDMDIIPSDLATYGSEAKKLLQDLQSRNERMFLLTFLVLNTADNPRQLGNNIFQAGSIAQKYNCQLTRLDFQQEEGLMSCLPLGLNQIEIQRGLTTSSTAIFVPFTTQELFQNGKEALSYVTHSGEGEGLLFYGSTILPFVDHFPKNTELYRIMTTKPQELKKKEDE